ncbi:hypothetical protein GCM10008023_13650 [Sphingomonas glacialis]|uniref:Uncharacterized protein n=1 Tax=Sphingomonas glacialis TaxID=658225 RepID=A0ABQ3LF01_9SPHN|nr:hypothetical protein GCM10008023_13650 [Sphingomonas glacialis]
MIAPLARARADIVSKIVVPSPANSGFIARDAQDKGGQVAREMDRKSGSRKRYTRRGPQPTPDRRSPPTRADPKGSTRRHAWHSFQPESEK